MARWPDDRMTRSVDPRHAPVRAAIAERYAAETGGLTVPWTGHTARVLADFLAANKGWRTEVLLRCVTNRFASDNINPAEDPIRWIRRLPNYVLGPLDCWGKPKKAPRAATDPIDEYWRRKRGQG
jgi:hypothetical protein